MFFVVHDQVNFSSLPHSLAVIRQVLFCTIHLPFTACEEQDRSSITKWPDASRLHSWDKVCGALQPPTLRLLPEQVWVN